MRGKVYIQDEDYSRDIIPMCFMEADKLINSVDKSTGEKQYLSPPKRTYGYIRSILYLRIIDYANGNWKELSNFMCSMRDIDESKIQLSSNDMFEKSIGFIDNIRPVIDALTFTDSFIFQCRMPSRFSYTKTWKKLLSKAMSFKNISLLMKDLWVAEISEPTVWKIYANICHDIKEFLQAKWLTHEDFLD